ncbi:MAG: hypothetical protein J6Q15_02830 [Clostridia bacterium]|nr:hypothetical protein [Clostridia bacterium]
MDKRPIIYVPAGLRYIKDGVMYKVAYYVSRATLKSVHVECYEDGTVEHEYNIHFMDIENAQKLYPKFYVCQGDATVSKIFKDYESCKGFVDELNYTFATTVGSISASKMEEKMELHKQAFKYCAELEEIYIPLDERRCTSEKNK